MIFLDYNRIIEIFDRYIGALSLEPSVKPLDEFFSKVPVGDRSMCEYFMRRDLKCNPIDDITEIFPGMYWDSDIFDATTGEVKGLEIPDKVKKYADDAFKGSNLENVVIKSANNGVINFDAFMTAPNLKNIYIDPSLNGRIKKIKAEHYNPNSKFITHMPFDMLDDIADGKISISGTGYFEEYLNDEDLCVGV